MLGYNFLLFTLFFSIKLLVYSVGKLLIPSSVILDLAL